MAIQYYMRAFNTALVQYVDWVVNDTPDSTGAFSGYPTNQLVNITVNRVVQSKVANFLKQNQSLGGTDGYFFHVNSYDWRNATAPILPPSTLVGFGVGRGVASVAPITGATNLSPIEITTSISHGLSTGQVTTISGVTGNVAANGTWPIIVTSPTSFTLTGSVGSGTYSAGTGTAYIPNDMSSLIWDEANDVWRLATVIKNNPGDSVTLGVSQSLKVNNFILDGYLAIGLDPADTGAIRLSNNTYIFSEANPTGTDVQLIGADLLNRIKLGVNTTDTVYVPGVMVVDGYIQHDGTGSNTAQTTGFIREQNSTNIIAFRGTASLAGSDIVALASSSNNVVLGDSVNTGILYNTSSGSVHQFQTNSTGRVEIGDPFIRFVASGLAGAPTIFQTTAGANITGQTLTVQAQNGGSGTSTGGILSLTSGTGTTAAGTLDLLTGGILQTRIFPDTGAGTTNGVNNNNSILFFQNALRFDTAQPAPSITHDQTNASSVTAQPLTIQAQSAIGTTSVGGKLILASGTGTPSTAQSGQVSIQTGGLPQIVIVPAGVIPEPTVAQTNDLIVIAGNLEVKGVITTVDSTVVDIIGRVVHANWADPVASPNVAVPSQITGYSIHRGNTGGIPRDGAAWLWTEGAQVSGRDGYWRAATILGDGYAADNYTIANSPTMFGVMASNFSSSPDPNPISGYVASVGSLRAINNVPSVAARSILATTTLTAAGLTNGIAALPLATITVVDTTAFTTSGSLLVVSSAGVQTLTYTGKTATTFTGVVGGTGNIVTGGIVAQTNASTFISATSNNVSLPQGTINVNSTTGFPAAGTLRIFTNTATGGVQTVAYTGITATTFTGCTGGLGVMNTGNAVVLVPLQGISDLVLLGTDFGNRILHGAPTANTGHIFNTPSGLLPPYIPYDFQVNNVTQVQLGQVDIDANGFFETIQIGPTVSNPRLVQQTLPNFGTTNGFNLGIFAQSGQQQTGVTTNNNGGHLFLVSGAQGTGGSGAAGIDGYVELRTGFTSKVRVFPTDAAPVGSSNDDNSILYFESLFRVDAAETGAGPLAGTGIRFRQDDTGSGVGATYTVQAQSAATTGGNLVLTSGTGSLEANAGQVRLSTGLTAGPTPTAVDRVIVYPTGSPALPQGSSNLAYTEFRDNTSPFRGVFITPVSTGISSIGFGTTVLGAQIAQVAATTTNGAPMTVQAQVTSLASGVGGVLSLIAGNATGTTSTGGNLHLASGSGTTINGVINFQPGGVTQVLITATGQFIQWVSTMANPTLNQVTTGGATGTTLTVQAQNAATTGGNLTLTSGTGGTVAGDVNIQTGGVSRIITHPTFTEFRDTAEALRITPVSAGTTQITYASTVTSAQINHTITAATPSAPMTIQSQVTSAASGQGGNLILIAGNATGTTSTGGNAILTSGTGTTVAGNTHLQTGGVDKIIVHPTFTEFRDTAEALRITPVSAGTTQITYASTATAAQINQTTTGAATGAPMTVQAQNAATTGGALTFTTGTGATNPGNMLFQIGGTTLLTLFNTATVPNTLQWLSTTTSPIFNQETTGGASGQAFTVQAQNAATTGGNLVLTSGTATTAGNVHLQTGAVDKVVVHPTFTEFRDTAEAYRITPVSVGATTLEAATGATSVTYRQADRTTVSGTGAPTTVQAQHETGTTSTGGALNLTSGTGTSTNGAVNLQVGTVTTASLVTDKFVFNKGSRRNVTPVTTTYQVLASDDYLAITTLAAPFTITLPAAPTLGDTYTIKDAVGNAGTSNVTISGNGANIDGTATILLSQNYAAVVLTYTGTQWSVS